MKRKIIVLVGLVLSLILMFASELMLEQTKKSHEVSAESKNYWLLLHRKSNKEFLYLGRAGDTKASTLIKTFYVKSGIPNNAPTPLPNLLGREYWKIVDREMLPDSPDIGPHFLTLDIPTTEEWPYGPTPYQECNGQCDWILPGYFGLHGIGGDESRLSFDDPGSLGCIRHKDEDIVYLYNTLDPKIGEIRYYVFDI